MYDRILLPTDGSDAAAHAAEEAVGLASETGADLHALFAVEDIPYAPELMDDEVGVELRTLGEEALEELRERAEAAGVPVTTAIREGTPHEAILDYVEAADIDVVVMGTHGRSGLERYLLGSVTEAVVRRSTVPVLTVRRPGGSTT